MRITWPNGLIQNETGVEAGSGKTYEEAQRLSGSCPMIFTWNGTAFRFITDVLGVAPLGASAGDGEFFPVDHDEYVQVPGAALVPVDGQYRVRITEELREVSYLDEVQLIAVDHPAAVEMLTNDKFKGPPFPDFRLFGVQRRIHPLHATASQGEEVRDLLLARDARYPTASPATTPGSPPCTRSTSTSATRRPTATPCWCCRAGWTGPTAAPTSPPPSGKAAAW